MSDERNPMETTERRALALATDTALADQHGLAAKAIKNIDWKLDELHRAAGDVRKGRWSDTPWTMTTAEVLAFDASGLSEWASKNFATMLADYEGEVAKLQEIKAEIARLDQVWVDNGRWHRYFLVNNNNGHVHRDQACSTCYPTTQYLWLVDLADCDETAMVAEYGEMACTVCFPDAPSMAGFGDGTSTLARYSAEEKAQRAAEKAAKAAAKEAKAIYSPDGSPLRTEYGIIKTEVTARREMSAALENHYIFGYTHRDYLAEATKIAEAIAHKTGEAEEALLAAAKTKVFKKHKRQEA